MDIPDHMTPQYKPQNSVVIDQTEPHAATCGPRPSTETMIRHERGQINVSFPTKWPFTARAGCHSNLQSSRHSVWSESHLPCSRIGDSLRSGWNRWEAFAGMFIILSSRQSSDHLADYNSPDWGSLSRLVELNGERRWHAQLFFCLFF